jgi:hypothetical protein
MDAYDEFFRRKESISGEGVLELGTQASIRLLRAREEWLVASSSKSCLNCQLTHTGSSVTNQDVIKRTFHDKFEDLRHRGVVVYGKDFVWLLDDEGTKNSQKDQTPSKQATLLLFKEMFSQPPLVRYTSIPPPMPPSPSIEPTSIPSPILPSNPASSDDTLAPIKRGLKKKKKATSSEV